MLIINFKKCLTLSAKLSFLNIAVDMETLFKESDFVTGHTALTQETAGKVESSTSPLKPTSPAVNIKR